MVLEVSFRRSRRQILPAVVLVAACVVATLPPPAFGQALAVNAQLNGSVLDPDGSVIVDALVTLSSVATSFQRTYSTTEEGRFVFSAIPPGTYSLSVEAVGFKTSVQDNIVLSVGQATTVNPRLELGVVTESIVVQAAPPILNTGNSNLGSEVALKQVQELPLNIRNVFGLVGLDSSVNNSQQNQALNPSGVQGNVDQDIAFFKGIIYFIAEKSLVTASPSR